MGLIGPTLDLLWPLRFSPFSALYFYSFFLSTVITSQTFFFLSTFLKPSIVEGLPGPPLLSIYISFSPINQGSDSGIKDNSFTNRVPPNQVMIPCVWCNAHLIHKPQKKKGFVTLNGLELC